MRTIVGLLIGGVAFLVVLKLLAALVLPLVGIFFGLIGMAIKLTILAAVAYFVYSFIRARRRGRVA